MGLSFFTTCKRAFLPVATMILTGMLLLGSLGTASAIPSMPSFLAPSLFPVQLSTPETPEGLTIDSVHKLAFVVSSDTSVSPEALLFVIDLSTTPPVIIPNTDINEPYTRLGDFGFADSNSEHIAVNPTTYQLYVVDEANKAILVVDYSGVVNPSTAPDSNPIRDQSVNTGEIFLTPGSYNGYPFALNNANLPIIPNTTTFGNLEPEGIFVDTATNLVYVTAHYGYDPDPTPGSIDEDPPTGPTTGVLHNGFLLAIDPNQQYVVVDDIEVGLLPEDIVLNPKNCDLYVACEGDGRLFVITKLTTAPLAQPVLDDTLTLKHAATPVPAPITAPNMKYVTILTPFANDPGGPACIGELGVDTAKGIVFASDDAYRLAAIDCKFSVTTACVGRKPKAGCCIADEIAVDSQRHLVYVTSNGQTIAVFDTSLKYVKTIKITGTEFLDGIGILPQAKCNLLVVDDPVTGLTFVTQDQCCIPNPWLW